MSRIEKINFVSYKNILENSEVNFPKTPEHADIVIFVGKNGSGKSSILHAIYGCCENCSIGDFWFDTALDEAKSYQDYWYEYPDQSVLNKYGKNPQVRQSRTFRKDRTAKKQKTIMPNYWESRRPTKDIGMAWSSIECKEANDSERWPKFKLQPKYIDFRHNATAFDSAVYGSNSLGMIEGNTAAKMRIVRASKNLKANVPYYKRKTNKITLLPSREIKKINEILGKSYSEITITYHNYYGSSNDNRVTILIKHKNLNYSDAYAGTGESAIIQLVHQIMSLNAPTVIILDEPESSLHVSAQKKLMDFLCQESFNRKHQIFISTHSPYLIEDKRISNNLVFICSDDMDGSGKTIIQSTETKEAAFTEVGIDNYRGIIYVEDKLIEIVTDFIIKDLGYTKENFHIVPLNGFDSFAKHIRTLENSSAVCLADGDQKKILYPPINLSKETFEQYFFDITGSRYPLDIKRKPEAEQVEILRTAIQTFLTRVKYLEYLDIESFIVQLIPDYKNHPKNLSGKSIFREHMENNYEKNFYLNEQISEVKRLLVAAKKDRNPDYLSFKKYIQNNIIPCIIYSTSSNMQPLENEYLLD